MERINLSLPRRSFLRAAVAVVGGVAAVPALAACGDPDESRLVFLNWQDYIDPTMLTDFTKKTGLQVTYETYASNDELAGRLNLASTTRRRGRQGTTFDLVVPSDNLLKRLRSLDALEPLDRSIVKLLGNLDPAFRALSFDPGNRFSVPWATGTTGIGYDTTVFSEPPDWSVFLDEKYRGKMTVLDERRDAFGVALFLAGKDPNTRDAAEIRAAADQLIAMKRVIKAFDSADYLDSLASGDLVCAHGYSTDVLQARERNPKLGFTIPEQGGFRWIDSLCIPAGAPNLEAANRFVNFYLQPEISATNAVASQVDTGNAKAREFVPKALLEDRAVFPDSATTSRLVFVSDLGDDEKIYDTEWERVTKT
jgi:spermidine/putrescine transport system substrate-binding protein